MSLSAGDRLGAYEIAAFIGAGGMGEVYVQPFPGPGDRGLAALDPDLAGVACIESLLSGTLFMQGV